MIGRLEEYCKKAEEEEIKYIREYQKRYKIVILVSGMALTGIATFLLASVLMGLNHVPILVTSFVFYVIAFCIFGDAKKTYKKAFPKGKFFSLGMILLISLSTVVAGAATNLATIEYEDTDIIAATGNVTLEYDSSDTGEEDVLLLWRIYSQESDMTIYCVRSRDILYDHTFINNTKNYTFYDNNTERYYTIRVDYSSISVPEGWEDILNETIAEKDAIIANLTLDKKNLTELIERMNTSIVILVNERDLFKQQRDSEIENNTPLRKEIDRLTLDVSKWRNKSSGLSGDVNDLQHEKDELNDTIDAKNYLIEQKEDMWCPDFKIPSFLIGVFLVGMIFISWKIKKNYKPEKKTEKKEKQIGITKKGMSAKLKEMKEREEKIEDVLAEKEREKEKNKKAEEESKEKKEENIAEFEADEKKEGTKPEKKPEKKSSGMYAFVDNYDLERPGMYV